MCGTLSHKLASPVGQRLVEQSLRDDYGAMRTVTLLCLPTTVATETIRQVCDSLHVPPRDVSVGGGGGGGVGHERVHGGVDI